MKWNERTNERRAGFGVGLEPAEWADLEQDRRPGQAGPNPSRDFWVAREAFTDDFHNNDESKGIKWGENLVVISLK